MSRRVHTVPRYKDETGNRYGRLVVLKYAGSNKRGNATWLCQCDCGEKATVLGSYLRSGWTQSCGCLHKEIAAERNFIDLVGHKYSRLTVIEQRESDKRGGSRWLCQCDCGKTLVVSSHNLRSGNTKSCGCLWKDIVLLPEGESAFNQLYNRIKQDVRGHEFDLTKEQVRALIEQPCHYCGLPPSQKMKVDTHGYNGGIVYNGIDRLDSTRGYVTGNVVPCCKYCNWAKNDRSVAEFRDWIKRVYDHFLDET
jgi:hypothetical protein